MTHSQDPLERAKAAFELADQGRLDEAAAMYRQAITGLDPTHYWSPQVHGQFASVLTRLGRIEEAGEHYQRALDLELSQSGDESAVSVVVARYFLAEHCLRSADPNRALLTVQSALPSPGKFEPMLRTVEAEALNRLGRLSEARRAAARALRAAGSEEQAHRIRERLVALLNVNEDR